MPTKHFSLPASGKSSKRITFRLDERGLEWTDEDGKDSWMPFACVRLATLGNFKTKEWNLRLSGPPGAIILSSGVGASPEDLAQFSELSRKMIEGAAGAGCRAKFRLNHKRRGPDWLWARSGKRIETATALTAQLPNGPEA